MWALWPGEKQFLQPMRRYLSNLYNVALLHFLKLSPLPTGLQRRPTASYDDLRITRSQDGFLP